MNKYKTFDIIGPIMIGPSSSHTAGACRIANAALNINEGEPFDCVEFKLHGSFASTYRGHGTDIALVAGINGIKPDDPKLRDAFEISKKNRIDYSFIETDLGNVHPNSVEIVLYYKGEKTLSVTGSSIGGGNIVIIAINDIAVEFKNEYSTLIFQYKERPGIISHISSFLANEGYNIETIGTEKKSEIVTLTIELTEKIEEELYEKIIEEEDFIFSKYIKVKEEA